MNYDIIAIDLDGTLLDNNGQPTAENIRAIRDAQDAGALVLPCTGRAWSESKKILNQIQGLTQGIFVTGAMINDCVTGKNIDLAMIEPHLLMDLVDLLYDQPEALLIFKDSQITGHDYLVTGKGQLTGNTQWWFDYCNAIAHHQQELTEDDYHHAMRLSMVASEDRMQTLIDLLESNFQSKILLHHFPIVTTPDIKGKYCVLEVFAAGVDKFRGINYIASQMNIPINRVAAIGDQINDTAMIQNVGLGIAMNNAIPQIKAIANKQTKSNQDSGVAYAIDQMLSGQW